MPQDLRPFDYGRRLQRDGKLDLAVVNENCQFFNCPAGRFRSCWGMGTARSNAVNFSTGIAPVAIITADLNGDGKLDLVTANNCGYSCNSGPGDALSVLLGNGDGTFQPSVEYHLTDLNNAVGVAAGDVNGDGKLDLVGRRLLRQQNVQRRRFRCFRFCWATATALFKRRRTCLPITIERGGPGRHQRRWQAGYGGCGGRIGDRWSDAGPLDFPGLSNPGYVAVLLATAMARLKKAWSMTPGRSPQRLPLGTSTAWKTGCCHVEPGRP